MNNKGQMGFSYINGIIVAVVTLLIFGALYSTIVLAFGMSKGNTGANCPGFIDSQATPGNNESYDPNKNSDRLACVVLGFGPGLIVLGVVLSIVMGIIGGKLGQEQQQNPYQYYGG